MHWTQAVWLAMFLAAAAIGRADWKVIAACLANFAGTALLAPSLLSVAVIDIATASFLLVTCGKKGAVLAAFYAIYTPVCVFGGWLGWPNSTTYAIVDAVGLLQFLVIARGDGRTGRVCWAADRRGSVTGGMLSRGGYSSGLAFMDKKEGPLNA